ncbi:hypothetical protein [Enterococcus crotali]|uniref:hypothetical protein n=1 Tax=Enterococcus crotali TaxID=1453587 RepID=UPI00047110E2|nr:hypothetical protein [Enterococcus crotali]OTP48556.1 hypothetical protein A5881_002257 [Enterococcus termitis]
MKKWIDRIVSKRLLTYLTFLTIYLYIINTFEQTSSILMYLFTLYILFFIIETTYTQSKEDRKSGKKKQSPSEFFHNVDWFVVLATAVVCIIIYVTLVILVNR